MSSVKEAAERMRDHMLTGKGWNGLVTVSEKDLDIVVRFALDAAPAAEAGRCGCPTVVGDPATNCCIGADLCDCPCHCDCPRHAAPARGEGE
jgi:hypothetical protein